jgi:hypothetical protein
MNRCALRWSRRNIARKNRWLFLETLEERQLMAMTVELRAADGSNSATVDTIGQQITLNIIGSVTAGVAGPNDEDLSSANPNTFGVGSLAGSIISSSPYQDAIAGNLTATVAQPFQGNLYQTGKLQDLNGDGNIDVGSTGNSSTDTDYWLGQSGYGEVYAGTVVGNAKQIVLGTVTYTVTHLNDGGETDINFFLRPEGGYFVANWFDGINYAVSGGGPGHFANEYLSNLSTGTPFVVTDPSLVVAPTAVNDTASVIRNTPTKISVLTNDTFIRPPDDSSLVIGSAPSHGTAIPQTDGTVLYTPSTGYTGTDSFTYTVDDTDGRVSNAATVSITVVPPPPPVAVAVTASTLKNQPDSINVISSDTVTSPATIVPADVQVVTVPAHGTAIPQSDGTIIYTPTTGYTGADGFTYTVEDTNGEVSSPGTVSITVNAPTPPTAGDVSGITTTAGAPVTITVLTSDSTPQGNLSAGSVTVVTQPTNGTAVAQSDGTIIYTPTAKYVGSDSFTYTVADTFGDVSNAGTVSITIGAGVPPVANPVTATAVSGQTNTINVLSNASSGAPLVPGTVAVVTPPTDGTATVNSSNGTIAYVPNAGFVGTDTFTYTVADVNGDTSSPADVSVNVGTTISSTKGAAHSLTFTDGAGGLETITLNKGSAELFFSGTGGSVTVGKNLKAVVSGTSLELSGITLSGTAANSTLSIRGSAKTPVTLGGITDNSAMGTISAPNAVLSGVVSLAGLGVLNVNSINSATIGIGATGPAHFSLTSGAINGLSLYSAVPIASLKAASWDGNSGANGVTIGGTLVDFNGNGLQAPSISSLSIAGAFSTTLALTSNGKTLALGNARIGGQVDYGWTVPGPTGTISFESASSNWSGTFGKVNSLTIRSGGLAGNGSPAITAGAIGSLVITGDLTAPVSAASARLIHVIGNINGSNIAITGALTQLVATGSLIGDSISNGANLTSLTAASMDGTNLQVGVIGSVTLATASTANLGTATLGTIRLTGRTGDQFTNSQILAGKVTTASLGSVTTSNSGSSFGIGTKSISSFSGIFGGIPLHAPHSALVNDTLLGNYLQQQGVTFGDFEILITG